jgi:hypothetical protein
MKINGIFAYQCKHGMYREGGVADFPKGERCASFPHFDFNSPSKFDPKIFK